ncbi:MAG: tRNA uridine-5-carboxymethylaminomethyl(34) synthesis GTPase MnmE [Clostridiaceae bacterium]|nr:tRNA uridine-5-carboxymethylaminomethyl(34) synthesis GTPase MnmE [Clostridiaceae bacterium]
MLIEKTIAAIATAPGEAGIGIVRISGEKSIGILKKVFKPKKTINIEDIPSRMAVYGHAVDRNGKVLDEILAIVMRKPYSYTTEDIVELHCHGGIVPVRRIMEEVLRNGADIAEPGEFTKRAFLNGRIDLAQAEAVIDVITSKTETGLNAALNQLEGELSKEISAIMDKLLSMIAHIEASIDFPEHDVEEITIKNIKNMLLDVKASTAALVDSFDEGKIVRDGLSTAIIGRPNVGKSSLLNVLLKENRAIVTAVPGTTRDIIEEYLNIGGVLIRLIDTAGIRESQDIVEQIGVERTKGAINHSDLVILVLDASNELLREDNEIINLIRTKKVIAVLNKTDLGLVIHEDYLKDLFGEDNTIKMSVKNRVGIDKLEERIKELVFQGKLSISKNNMVTSIRHKNLLDRALENIERAISSIEDGIPVDLISVDIREAWSSLGAITGDTVEEDIIKEIFSKFCIGK